MKLPEATTNESDNPWADYLDCMKRLEAQVKLVAFHTRETARYAEKAADMTLLTVYHIREYLNEKDKLDER